MKILQIRFKNFMSYGEEESIIDFENRNSLFLIKGDNGVGKSTLSYAIKFSIYGKVDGYNIPDLPNRVNQKLETYIKLINYKGDLVEIERGIKPNKFQIRINGKPAQVGEISNKVRAEEILENDVIGIPFKVFCNLLVLSINDFKSFLKMSVRDKRDIIDKIFSLDELNKMFSFVREQRKNLYTKISDLTSSIKTLEGSINDVNLQIEESKKKELDDITSIKISLVEKHSILQRDEFILDESCKEIQLTLNDEESQLKLLETGLINTNNEIAKVNSKLKLLDEGKCTKCGTLLTEDKHLLEKEELQKSKFELNDHRAGLVERIEIIKKSQRKKREELDSLKNDRNLLLSEIKGIEIEIKDLDKPKRASSSLHDLISKFSKEISSKKEILQNLENKDGILEILENGVLNENGVKKQIVKGIVPMINSSIKKYTNSLHFGFEVNFDDDFNIVIKHLGDDVSSNTLSFGERKMADLIIILSIINAIKIKYPSLNLIFLDEIFSSIDQNNLQRILNLFKEATHEMGMNMMVISHNELSPTAFDKIVQINKNKGWSSIEINEP